MIAVLASAKLPVSSAATLAIRDTLWSMTKITEESRGKKCSLHNAHEGEDNVQTVPSDTIAVARDGRQTTKQPGRLCWRQSS